MLNKSGTTWSVVHLCLRVNSRVTLSEQLLSVFRLFVKKCFMTSWKIIVYNINFLKIPLNKAIVESVKRLFWFHDWVVILCYYGNSKQWGNINYACLGNQRERIKLSQQLRSLMCKHYCSCSININEKMYIKKYKTITGFLDAPIIKSKMRSVSGILLTQSNIFTVCETWLLIFHQLLIWDSSLVSLRSLKPRKPFLLFRPDFIIQYY